MDTGRNSSYTLPFLSTPSSIMKIASKQLKKCMLVFFFIYIELNAFVVSRFILVLFTSYVMLVR